MKTALVVALILSCGAASTPVVAQSLVQQATTLALSQAQTGDDAGWSPVEQLETNASLVVVRGQESLRGNFIEANETSLSLRRADTVERIPRAEIIEVRRARGKGSSRGAKVGAYTGLALSVGIGFGMAMCERGACDGGRKAAGVLAMVGVPVGLGIAGYYAGSAPPEVIYRARRG